MKSHLPHAREAADKLLQIGAQDNDEAKTLEAHHCQWATLYASSNLEEAYRHSAKGIDIYRAESHHPLTYSYGGHDPGTCAHTIHGTTLWILGYPEKSVHQFQLANELRMDLLAKILWRDQEAIKQLATYLGELASTDKSLDSLNLSGALSSWVGYQEKSSKEDLACLLESADLVRARQLLASLD